MSAATTYKKVEAAPVGSGFDPKFFAEIAALEQHNFWFRARNSLIVWFLGKSVKPDAQFFEIGFGTGVVLNAVAKSFPGMRLLGGELFSEALEFARKQVPMANLFICDATEISALGDYDCIGAFDVLEHIEDDHLALRNIYAALAPGGFLMATVPQHTWLWSPSDEIVFHHRRYSPGELESKLCDHGFHVVRSTSFMFFLLPLMALSRIWQRVAKPKFNVFSELRVNTLLSWVFSAVLRLEILAIKAGINFPAGGSRFVLARKPLTVANEGI
jgi:trans-aconitate methyltransferase